MKSNNNIIILSLETMLLLLVACCNCSCIGRSHYQTISHNKLRGKTDYIYFTSVDTGYMITHLGELYMIDSIRCTYVYQTVDGGAYWEIVDSIPDFEFDKYSHITRKDVVYGYLDNGTSNDDGYSNSYLCFIDLKRHRHRVRNEAIYGPGKVYILNDSIHFPIYKAKEKYILRLDDELNNLFCGNDTLPKSIKNISYNDSSLAIITYGNKMYYLQSGKMSEYQIDLPCDGILLSGNDCFISYWGNKEHDGGVIRHDCLSDNYEKLDFPSGYKVVEILKASNDSVIITCTQKYFCGFNDDIIYSTDRGQTWKKIHLSDPIIFPEYSSYCAPYLYIESTFFSEIYKLRIE